MQDNNRNDWNDLRFQKRPHKTEPNNTLMWQIAGGVCLGLLAFAGIDRYLEHRREVAAVEAWNREIAKINADTARQQQAWRDQAQYNEARKQNLQEARWEAQRIKADERCINGQRFRRVENGWVQTGTC